MAKDQDLAIARTIKERLVGRIPLFKVKLFGSRARGEADPDSDLDLY